LRVKRKDTLFLLIVKRRDWQKAVLKN